MDILFNYNSGILFARAPRDDYEAKFLGDFLATVGIDLLLRDGTYYAVTAEGNEFMLTYRLSDISSLLSELDK